ncbi:MAG: flagellar hook-length control protein FliK [Ruminiclostridium sp.]|nr:flagellar hook-length control protein FliK [Ruminiclostridium sp.]
MRINTVIAEQSITTKGLADIPGKLDIGDVIRAKVLEMASDYMILKLFDGTVFHAATLSEIDTAPGESLELVVKSKDGGNLVLETVKKDTSAMDNPHSEEIKLLKDVNIKPDIKNIQLAGEIIKAGFNTSKELFEKASRLLDRFVSLSPEKAVFLSSKSVLSEPRAINTIIKIIEGDLRIGSQLEELYSIISMLSEDKNIEKAITGGQEVSKKGAPAANGQEMPKKEMPAESGISKKIFKQNNVDLFDEGLMKSPQIAADSDLNKTLDRKQGNTVSKGVPEAGLKETDIYKNSDPDQDILLYNKKIENTKNENNIENNVNGNNRNEIGELASKLKESFKSMFIRIDSENLSSELDATKIYKDILDKLESIKHINQTLNLPEKTEIAARVNNIEEGIKLLNQISTDYNYVQIPLNISSLNTTADLYIMKRNRSKKGIDPQNVIMLISLDTRNLGRIETLMEVRGKNVGINLRAEEQKVIGFLRDNYRHLFSSLMDKGYRLVDVKYRLLEERINPVNVVSAVKKVLEDGRISVDFKI